MIEIVLMIIAITKRKVSVKFLVNSRASHKYLMIRHLKKLIEVDPALVQVKIYSVCIFIKLHRVGQSFKRLQFSILVWITHPTRYQLGALSKREIFIQGNIRGFHGTHTKMMVTENSGFIGKCSFSSKNFKYCFKQYLSI